jgi:hypothetical protein
MKKTNTINVFIKKLYGVSNRIKILQEVTSKIDRQTSGS